MTSQLTKARWLALSILAGSWDEQAIADRLRRALPQDFDQVDKLTARLRVRFDDASPPDVDTLVDYVLVEPLLTPILDKDVIKGPLLDSPVMSAAPATLVTLPLPELETWTDVSSWLSLTDRETAWFADCRSQQSRVTEQKLHHYRYAWVPKRSGNMRLIEAPKARLKAIQRTILREILNRVPPHSSAHGFCRGRSTQSYVAPHVGKEVVLRLDLKDFFHSVPVARIGALFRQLGYPSTVSWLLQGFCTSSVSPSLAGKPYDDLPWKERKQLEGKHLAQGAPTSAQLANLCAWRMDCRLDGLAKQFGLAYSRYADDLAFSGTHKLARTADFIEALVGAIAMDEGFRLNHRKTRLRLRSQRQCLAGIVVNEKVNCRRAEWDRLKATLHNCRRHGPKSQNVGNHRDFEAHLRGRIAYVSWLNPNRAARLEKLWAEIDWNA